jgi:hypothetical protein
VVFYMARKAQFPNVTPPQQEAPLAGSTPVPIAAPANGRGSFQPAHK